MILLNEFTQLVLSVIVNKEHIPGLGFAATAFLLLGVVDVFLNTTLGVKLPLLEGLSEVGVFFTGLPAAGFVAFGVAFFRRTPSYNK